MLTHLAGPYVVGVDAGGTKTRCTVLTLGGAVAGSGIGPGANPNSGGDTAGALTKALSTALGDLNRSHVLNGVFGIAGAGAAGRPAAVAAARRAWYTAGLRGSPAVVTDIAVAFASGTSEPQGIVVFAGTGAGAAAISHGAIVHRADGYGPLVGDAGSAVWLGTEAVRATLAAYDGRGSPTLLAESVPRALLGPAAKELTPRARAPEPSMAMAAASGDASCLMSTGSPLATLDRPAPNPALAQAIIKEVYSRPPAALGRLGPVVCAAAAAGDPVAGQITDEAAQWLLRDVDAVRAALDDPYAPVVMAGSVLSDGPVADAVRSGLRERFASEPCRAGDGAVGAGGMALRRLCSLRFGPTASPGGSA